MYAGLSILFFFLILSCSRSRLHAAESGLTTIR